MQLFFSQTLDWNVETVFACLFVFQQNNPAGFAGVVQNVVSVDLWNSSLISVDAVFVCSCSLAICLSLIKIAGCYLYICAIPVECFSSAQCHMSDSRQCSSKQRMKKCLFWLQVSSCRLAQDICPCCHNIMAIVISSQFLPPIVVWRID